VGTAVAAVRVAEEDEAIALANSSAQELGGAVFSSDQERTRRVARYAPMSLRVNRNAPRPNASALMARTPTTEVSRRPCTSGVP
jgi:acyl-CoA reductase-like NAD-dependent aldehyde dehydrogenase